MIMVAPRVGAWIETNGTPINYDWLYQSRPAWARGLKPILCRDKNRESAVAPRVGAWIETDNSYVYWDTLTSRPAWARGLKP